MFLEVIMAATTELDMEAAEQLIQLSGCCCSGGGGESESRVSTDSVSKKRGRRKEEDQRAAASGEEAMMGDDADDIDEVVIGGEARRRPRFRSLAAVYKETRRLRDDAVVGCRAGSAEDGERTTTATKRATDAAAGEVAVPVTASKGREVQVVANT